MRKNPSHSHNKIKLLIRFWVTYRLAVIGVFKKLLLLGVLLRIDFLQIYPRQMMKLPPAATAVIRLSTNDSIIVEGGCSEEIAGISPLDKRAFPASPNPRYPFKLDPNEYTCACEFKAIPNPSPRAISLTFVRSFPINSGESNCPNPVRPNTYRESSSVTTAD